MRFLLYRFTKEIERKQVILQFAVKIQEKSLVFWHAPDFHFRFSQWLFYEISNFLMFWKEEKPIVKYI